MELIKKEAPSSRFMGRKGSWPGLTPRGGTAALVAPSPYPPPPKVQQVMPWDRAALPNTLGWPCVLLEYELFQHVGQLRGF